VRGTEDVCGWEGELVEGMEEAAGVVEGKGYTVGRSEVAGVPVELKGYIVGKSEN
jgi:hypothetical protein